MWPLASNIVNGEGGATGQAGPKEQSATRIRAASPGVPLRCLRILHPPLQQGTLRLNDLVHHAFTQSETPSDVGRTHTHFPELENPLLV